MYGYRSPCRKPLVLCVQDIRVQANVGHEGEQGAGEATQAARGGHPGGREGEVPQARGERNRRWMQNVLAKVLFFGQVCTWVLQLLFGFHLQLGDILPLQLFSYVCVCRCMPAICGTLNLPEIVWECSQRFLVSCCGPATRCKAGEMMELDLNLLSLSF